MTVEFHRDYDAETLALALVGLVGHEVRINSVDLVISDFDDGGVGGWLVEDGKTTLELTLIEWADIGRIDVY